MARYQLMIVVVLIAMLSSILVLAESHETGVPTATVEEAGETPLAEATEPSAEDLPATEPVTEEIPSEPRETSTPSQPAVEFTVDPGILPDSPFYFLDELFERVGNDPQKALEYREEKIAEAKAVAKKKNVKAVRKALAKAQAYGLVLEEEVTPEMEEEFKKSSQAIEGALEDVSDDVPELEGEIKEQLDQEERITLAAEVSGKIKDLCKTLATLDPKQYAEICKADKAAPKWQKELDEQLTEEQKGEAKAFVEKMTVCSAEPAKCDCKGIGVKSFEEVCLQASSATAECQKGDETACQAMLEYAQLDMKDYLPEHLVNAVKSQEEKFRQSVEVRSERGEYKEIFPPVCQKAGVSTPQECMKLMGKPTDGMMGTPAGPPARIQEFGRDCHALQDLNEKVRCFEEFYNAAKGKVEQRIDVEGYKSKYKFEFEEGKIKEEFEEEREFDDEKEGVFPSEEVPEGMDKEKMMEEYRKKMEEKGAMVGEGMGMPEGMKEERQSESSVSGSSGNRMDQATACAQNGCTWTGSDCQCGSSSGSGSSTGGSSGSSGSGSSSSGPSGGAVSGSGQEGMTPEQMEEMMRQGMR